MGVQKNLVRQKTSLTWKWRIKFFSLVILVGKTLSIKNPTDDTLSSLSNLRKSRWRPRGQSYKENACSVI